MPYHLDIWPHLSAHTLLQKAFSPARLLQLVECSQKAASRRVSGFEFFQMRREIDKGLPGLWLCLYWRLFSCLDGEKRWLFGALHDR